MLRNRISVHPLFIMQLFATGKAQAHQKRNSVFISSELPTPSSLRSARLLSLYAVYLICVRTR